MELGGRRILENFLGSISCAGTDTHPSSFKPWTQFGGAALFAFFFSAKGARGGLATQQLWRGPREARFTLLAVKQGAPKGVRPGHCDDNSEEPAGRRRYEGDRAPRNKARG